MFFKVFVDIVRRLGGYVGRCWSQVLGFEGVYPSYEAGLAAEAEALKLDFINLVFV